MKIGLAVGLGLVSVAGLWLATRPSLTPQARMQHLPSASGSLKGEAFGDGQLPAFGERSPSAKGADAGRPSVPPSSPARTPPARSPRAEDDGGATGALQRQDNAPNSTRSGQAEPIKTETFYIVRKGDTLSGISHKYYGSASRWPKIFEANRQTIPDANKLPIGTKLIIPD